MNNNAKCNSYSDLFEDFFRTDAVQDNVIEFGSGVGDDIFKGFLNDNESGAQSSDTLMLQNGSDQYQNFFMQQQQPQMSFFQQAQNPAYSYQANAIPATVQKPGFIRNRTRKNMRQKSVAAAVKASHMMAAAGGQAGSGFPLVQMYQPNVPAVVANHIPFYQAAAQIPAYQPPQPSQQPQMILAKSPVTQSSVPLMRQGHPSLPASPARSPNSNSSDYVKMKLQQKIRAKMVSKGQIPPNPTEEELRMCGVQVPSLMNHQHNSQLPTPTHSPQIPRAFNNNTAAFIAAPVMINNQSQGQMPMQQNDDLMMYLDLSGCSQKDPLSMPESNVMQSIKQQQQHQQNAQIQQISQPEFTFSQQEAIQNGGSMNYDQFFSDFILY